MFYTIIYHSAGGAKVDLGLFWGETKFIAAEKAHTQFQSIYPTRHKYKAL